MKKIILSLTFIGFIAAIFIIPMKYATFLFDTADSGLNKIKGMKNTDIYKVPIMYDGYTYNGQMNNKGFTVAVIDSYINNSKTFNHPYWHVNVELQHFEKNDNQDLIMVAVVVQNNSHLVKETDNFIESVNDFSLQGKKSYSVDMEAFIRYSTAGLCESSPFQLAPEQTAYLVLPFNVNHDEKDLYLQFGNEFNPLRSIIKIHI